MDQDVKNYINLGISALAGGAASGGAVAATTHDPWPIGAAAVTGFAIAITQHLRQIPRKEWTEEERAAKTLPPVVQQPKGPV